MLTYSHKNLSICEYIPGFEYKTGMNISQISISTDDDLAKIGELAQVIDISHIPVRYVPNKLACPPGVALNVSAVPFMLSGEDVIILNSKKMKHIKVRTDLMTENLVKIANDIYNLIIIPMPGFNQLSQKIRVPRIIIADDYECQGDRSLLSDAFECTLLEVNSRHGIDWIGNFTATYLRYTNNQDVINLDKLFENEHLKHVHITQIVEQDVKLICTNVENCRLLSLYICGLQSKLINQIQEQIAKNVEYHDNRRFRTTKVAQ